MKLAFLMPPLLATMLGLAYPAMAAEPIEIPSDDKPIKATLYRPAGDGPFPAVVALHGCSGLHDNAGHLRTQYDDWGQHLAAAGFLVVFPDSYASRGLASQCRNSKPDIRPDRERLADARATRDWLHNQSFAVADRVSLLGWDNGGIVALWAVRPQAEPDDDRPDFRAAVALYPGCQRLGNVAWSARIPTLILVGAADNWRPARLCEQMLTGARGRSAKATLIKYRGAHHGFDRDNFPVQQRTGLAFTSDGSGRATVGGQPDARADARKRVPEWLKR